MAVLPALQLTVSLLPSLLGPPLVTYFVLTRVPLHVPLAGLLIAILSVISLPLVMYVSLKWRDFRDRRDAERLGAVLPPRVKDTTLFNTAPLTIPKYSLLGERLLHVVRFILSLTSGLIFVTSGESASQLHEQYGNIFNRRIFSENRVKLSTIDIVCRVQLTKRW